jgi:hypothetical protein
MMAMTTSNSISVNAARRPNSRMSHLESKFAVSDRC